MRIKLPEGPSLLHGPVDLVGWTDWQRHWGRGVRSVVAKQPGGSEDWLSEPGRANHKVVLGRPFQCDQNGDGLPRMDVERFVVLLQSVTSLDFDQGDIVVLNPEVDRSSDSHIGNPELVYLSWNVHSNIHKIRLFLSLHLDVSRYFPFSKAHNFKWCKCFTSLTGEYETIRTSIDENTVGNRERIASVEALL